MAYKDPPKEHQFSSTNQPKKNGRKKGSRNLTTILREIMEADKGTLDGVEVDGKVLLMARLYQKALNSKGDNIKAIREILDRIEGKAIQRSENKNENTHNISKIKVEFSDDPDNKGD